MSTEARSDEAFVPLGSISGIHGVAGGVKVHSHTRPREAIFHYDSWLLGEQRRAVRVLEGGPQGKTLIARLEGVDDRDAARALIGQEIAVSRSELPALGEGDFYWVELVGLTVFTRDGRKLGVVDRLMETGANDVLVIRGDREHLVPYVPGMYVLRIDLEAGRMDVDWDPDF